MLVNGYNFLQSDQMHLKKAGSLNDKNYADFWDQAGSDKDGSFS
jgi:hypothetical protein